MEVFCKNGALKKFTIFTEKRLCWSQFFNKVADSSCLKHCRFIKKRLQRRHFSVNIANFMRKRIMKSICEEHFLKKLVASVLLLYLLNADYLLTGELISKKKWFVLSKKMFTFWYYFKIKTIHRRTYRDKTEKLCWRKLLISKSLLLQGPGDNNFDCHNSRTGSSQQVLIIFDLLKWL